MPADRIFTEELWMEIRDQYQEGVSVAALARAYDCDPRRITKHATESHWHIKHKHAECGTPPDVNAESYKNSVLREHKNLWWMLRQKVEDGIQNVPSDKPGDLRDYAVALKSVQSGERLALGVRDTDDAINKQQVVSWIDDALADRMFAQQSADDSKNVLEAMQNVKQDTQDKEPEHDSTDSVSEN